MWELRVLFNLGIAFPGCGEGWRGEGGGGGACGLCPKSRARRAGIAFRGLSFRGVSLMDFFWKNCWQLLAVNYTAWKVSILGVFSRIQTEYGEILFISPYLVQMREKTHQKSSQYGHFSCSTIFANKSIIEVWQGHKHAFVINTLWSTYDK